MLFILIKIYISKNLDWF